MIPGTFAQVQSHPLSELHPINISLNLTGVNITNVSYVFFGNNSVDTYLYRPSTDLLRTDSDFLVSSGGWLNTTGNLNVSLSAYIRNVLADNWINSTNFNGSKFYQNNNLILDFSGFNAANLTSGIVPLARLSSLTTSQFVIDLGLGWANLTAYPTACTSSQTVTTFADTLTCSAISIAESQISNLQSYLLNNSAINTTTLNISSTVTANQIISNNWLNSSSLNISGTQNVSINSPKFFIDTTNSRIGIGTTSPQSLLHINGSNNNAMLNISNGTGNILFINGTEQRIRIGTTTAPVLSDASILDVNGDITINSAIRARSNPGNNYISLGDGSMSFVIGGGTQLEWTSLVFAFNNRQTISTTVNNALSLNTTGTGILAFSTGGSEKVRIDSSGNMGIGTTSPNQKLEVVGGINATTWINSTNINSTGAVNFGGNVTITNSSANAGWIVSSIGQRHCLNGTGCGSYIVNNGSHVIIQN